MNDLRILRDRQTAASTRLDRATGDDPHGSAALCGVVTTTGSFPVVPIAYYAVNSALIYGSEAEGATPTFDADAPTIIYAINLGTMIPPTGTIVVIHAVGGRWCFRYDG